MKSFFNRKLKGSVIVELTRIFPVIFIISLGMFAVTLYCFEDTLESTSLMEQVSKTLSYSEPPYVNHSRYPLTKMKRKGSVYSSTQPATSFSSKAYASVRMTNSYPTESKVTGIEFFISGGKGIAFEAISNKWFDLRFSAACR